MNELVELLAAAQRADADYASANQARRDADSAARSAESAAINAWNAVHKALREQIDNDGSCLRRSDLGPALDKSRRQVWTE